MATHSDAEYASLASDLVYDVFGWSLVEALRRGRGVKLALADASCDLKSELADAARENGMDMVRLVHEVNRQIAACALIPDDRSELEGLSDAP